MLFFGAFLGSLFWSILSKSYGTRVVIRCSIMFSTLFGSLCGFAPSIGWMLIFQALTGWALGGSMVCYTFFLESAPNNYKYNILLLLQTFWVGGSFYASCIAWISFVHFTDHKWRVFIFLLRAPFWLICLTLPWVPKSSRFTFTKSLNITQSAENIDSGNFDGSILNYDFYSTVYHYYYSPTINIIFLCCITTFVNLTITLISPTIFKDYDLYQSVFIMILGEVISLVYAFVALDYIGRKKTLHGCFFAAGIGILLFFILFDGEGVRVLGGLLIHGFLSLAFYINYIYFSEFYPLSFRSSAIVFINLWARVASIFSVLPIEGSNLNITFVLCLILVIMGFFSSLFLPFDTTDRPNRRLGPKYSIQQENENQSRSKPRAVTHSDFMDSERIF